MALVVGLVVAVDQLTKHWAVSQLDDGRIVHVVWTLQFNLAFNSGMAFGRGRGWGPVIGVIAMLVVVALVLSIRRRNNSRMSLAVGLVVAGALGNIIDRLFRNEGWLRGEVVDFIDFQWFPIFNVADIAVNVGGVLLLWLYVRAPMPSKNV
ncbi:MAG: signal peptidase II [Actinomycetota bacterium]